MTRNRSHLRLVCLLAGLMTPAPCAAQAAPVVQTPAATLQQRLDRVRGDIFTRPDRINDAIKELHQILAIDDKVAEAHLLLGLAMASQPSREMRSEAIAEFRQALALEPRLTPARFYLARMYLDLGQPDRAREEILATLQAAPAQAQFLVVLAEAERQLGNPQRAAEVARQALAADPAFAQARYYLALALIDAKEHDQAITELEQLVKSGAKVPDVYFALGSAYSESGRVDDTITTLEAGIKLAPPRPDIRIRLARAYRTKGQLTQAEQQLVQTLPPGTAMQASAYYQDVERDLALETGRLRIDQGRVADAVASFIRSLEMDPEHGPAHQALAEAYLRQQEFAKAAEHATRADTLGAPLSPDQQAALRAGLAARAKGQSE